MVMILCRYFISADIVLLIIIKKETALKEIKTARPPAFAKASAAKARPQDN